MYMHFSQEPWFNYHFVHHNGVLLNALPNVISATLINHLKRAKWLEALILFMPAMSQSDDHSQLPKSIPMPL